MSGETSSRVRATDSPSSDSQINSTRGGAADAPRQSSPSRRRATCRRAAKRIAAVPWAAIINQASTRQTDQFCPVASDRLFAELVRSRCPPGHHPTVSSSVEIPRAATIAVELSAMASLPCPLVRASGHRGRPLADHRRGRRTNPNAKPAKVPAPTRSASPPLPPAPRARHQALGRFPQSLHRQEHAHE